MMKRLLALAATASLLSACGSLPGAIGLPGSLETAVREAPHTGAAVDASRTVWVWVAGLGALVSVAATAAAVRYAPDWPAMSQKYDAPGAAPETPAAPESADSIDLWKSMDEGHDPTR